jgi:hypothetical protein
MKLQERIDQQRLDHIITSYALVGEDTLCFQSYLQDLLRHYPTPLIELSLVEVLVRHWSLPPLPRGIPFLQEAWAILHQWEQGEGTSSITSIQFEWITGLTPLRVSHSQLNICG